jgi:enolase
MTGTSPLELSAVHAVEILDSRGGPTLAVTVTLADGTTARAGVPSGASTGSREAVELRDGDKDRYGGKGVLTAVGNVNGELADALVGRSFADPAAVDQAMRDLDGTPNKARLGANGIVGVSIATYRAYAASAGVPLWKSLSPAGVTPCQPVPHFNVVNGGVHAPNSLDFQEFMIAPLGAPSIAEAIRAGAQVYATLKRLLHEAGYATGLGDEGGFAPDISTPEDVLRTLVQAITDSGYTPGRDSVAIAMDPASSEFYRDGAYRVAGEALSSADMIDRYEAIITEFPVWSIEDGLAERDQDGWIAITQLLGDRVQLVGDDNFCTNPAIIADAITRNIANSALIKVNQIGTVSETLEAMRPCREAGYTAMVSPVRGDRGLLHRRPRCRDRLRTDQDRRPSARRTGRQVQPVAGDRRQQPRDPLRRKVRRRAGDRRRKISSARNSCTARIATELGDGPPDVAVGGHGLGRGLTY